MKIHFFTDIRVYARWLLPVLLILSLVTLSHQSMRDGKFVVSNDSPTLIGSPITFNVTLSDYEGYPLFYRIYFKDDLNKFDTYFDTHKFLSTAFIYDGQFDPNRINSMNITVELWLLFTPLWIVGRPALSQFSLTNDITGSISLNQSDVPDTACNNSLVSISSPANFAIQVHDPSSYLTNLTYQWLVNGSRQDDYKGVTFDYTFPTVGDYAVSTIVIGSLINSKTVRQGTITRIVHALEPVKDIVKVGATSIVRDNNLKLTLTLSGGTPDFWHCMAILPSNKSILPCDNPIVSNNDTFTLEKYFREKGIYFLKIRGGNDVSIIKKEILIDVQDFIKQPQLSVVVIPIVCSILALTIVVFGVAYHVNHQHNYTVETADFDFQKHLTEDLIEKTFFERLRDTFVGSIRSFFTCGFVRSRWERLREYPDSDSSVNDLPPIGQQPQSSSSSSSSYTTDQSDYPNLNQINKAKEINRTIKTAPEAALGGDSGVHLDA